MSWWSSDDPRRSAAVVVVVLAAALVVGLGVGLLLGIAGGGGSVQVSASTPPAASSPTDSSSPPSTRPTTRAASEIERGTRQDIGYFVGAGSENDGTHVTFDRVLLKIGRDARDYARKFHKPPPGPDGVLLVNDNDLTRDLVLAPDVQVMGTRQLAESEKATEVPLDTLLEAVASDGSDLLLDLRYDKLGYVVEITEHDLP